MGYRSLYVFLFFVLTAGSVIQQPGQVTIRAPHETFGTDNLGNVYLLRGEELQKFLPSGKQFARYSNLRLGNITSMDATNPLKILLYYRDFQQIVFLDNQLSQNSETVSLERLGFEQTELVCAGANNSFWIFSRQNNELIRFNEQSKKIAFTGNLKQILQTELNPNFMLEYNNFLYLNCPETGIYVFDIFGAFSKLIPLKGLSALQVYDQIIYFQKEQSLCSYDQKTFEESCKNFALASEIRGMRYVNKQVYLNFKDSVVIRRD